MLGVGMFHNCWASGTVREPEKKENLKNDRNKKREESQGKLLDLSDCKGLQFDLGLGFSSIHSWKYGNLQMEQTLTYWSLTPSKRQGTQFEVAESLISCLDPRHHLAPTRGTDHDHQDHNNYFCIPMHPNKNLEKRVVRRGRPAFYSHPSSYPQGITSWQKANATVLSQVCPNFPNQTIKQGVLQRVEDECVTLFIGRRPTSCVCEGRSMRKGKDSKVQSDGEGV